MLSIIISSYKPDYFDALIKNIDENIGTEYEIVKIDNPGLMGICSAYNRGAELAKYENLLFLHEDVRIDSPNWWNILEKYYNIPDMGVIGLAGNKRKFKLPYGFHSGINHEARMFLYHSGENKYPFHKANYPYQVKVIDGVFIGMKKKVWEEIKFNEKIIGFHFYDLDISLRTSKLYKNYLVSDLDITHFSKGNFGDQWINACIKFHDTENNYVFDEISPKEKRDVRNFWYKRLFTEEISFGKRLRYALNMGFNKDTLKAAVEFLIHKKF